MNEHIETNVLSAWNTVTGAKVRLNMLPIDWSSDAFVYEYPNIGQEVGFPACWIEEDKQVELFGRMQVIKVSTGIILMEGNLKALIEAARGPSANAELINTLLLECYELISAYQMSYIPSAPYYASHPDAHFQIFEVEMKQFYTFYASRQSVGPEAIQRSAAKLVFQRP